MKKRNKTSDNTIIEKEKSVNTTGLRKSQMSSEADLIEVPGSGEKMPYNETMRRILLKEAIDLANNDPEVLSLEDYLARKNFYRQTWWDWVRRDDWFRKGHEHILMILASKRDSGAIRNKYNAVAAYKRIHQLEPNPDVWKQIYEDNKKKSEEMSKPTQIIIEMPQVGTKGDE